MQTRAGAANLEASRLHALCSLLLQFRSTHLTNTYPVHAAGLARGQAPREMPLCCSLPHPPPCLCGLLLHPFWKLLQRPLRPQPLRFYTLLPCLHRTPNVCDDSAGGHAAMPHDVGIARRKRLLGARGWAGAGARRGLGGRLGDRAPAPLPVRTGAPDAAPGGHRALTSHHGKRARRPELGSESRLRGAQEKTTESK